MRLADRLWSKIVKQPNGCWIWQGTKRKGVYGQIWIQGKMRYVHRVMWRILVGRLTLGLTLDHLCKNILCCNPDHLEEVTMRENILRGDNLCAQNARKTHCSRGHKFSKENTYHRNDGGRRCRACARLSWKRCHNQRKEQSLCHLHHD